MRPQTVLTLVVVVCCLSFAGPTGAVEINPCRSIYCGSRVCRAVDGMAKCYDRDGNAECPPWACPLNRDLRICASNGLSYYNLCDFENSICRSGQTNVTVVANHKCPPRKDSHYEPCEHVTCRQGTVCKKTEGQARCFGQDGKVECPTGKCMRGVEFICGSDGKTYRNACLFEHEACESGSDVNIVFMRKCDWYGRQRSRSSSGARLRAHCGAD